MNPLYSEDVEGKYLGLYGEKSDLVPGSPEAFEGVGYMTTEPDGSYGNDTIIAVKQFQSRNDQIVDGYLGPATRVALNSSDAVPNGLALGDSGDNIRRVQNLLQ